MGKMCRRNVNIYMEYLNILENEEDDEDDFENEILMLLMANQSQRKRRFWVHPTIAKRENLGEFHRLISELEVEDEQLKRYFRLRFLTPLINNINVYGTFN